jgi:hypothetical protein
MEKERLEKERLREEDIERKGLLLGMGRLE